MSGAAQLFGSLSRAHQEYFHIGWVERGGRKQKPQEVGGQDSVSKPDLAEAKSNLKNEEI